MTNELAANLATLGVVLGALICFWIYIKCYINPSQKK
jgi:uncharacterized membrane protein YciS (DUF1049 family)